MSCDAVALAATLWLASTSATPTPAQPTPMLTPPSVASEPLFVGIVQRAAKLKAETKAYESAPATGGVDQLQDFNSFEAEVKELSSLDMQGHVTLVQRGYTDDLKCILKGISQDLPVKLSALEASNDAKARHDALEDMFYLLRDNV